MSNVGLASLCSNPSLDEKTLLPALHAFNTEFTSTHSLACLPLPSSHPYVPIGASYEGSPSEKKVIFGGLRRAIDTLSEPGNQPPFVRSYCTPLVAHHCQSYRIIVQFAALLAIKLITRSRTHLEPLYQPEYVSFLVQFAARTTIDTVCDTTRSTPPAFIASCIMNDYE